MSDPSRMCGKPKERRGRISLCKPEQVYGFSLTTTNALQGHSVTCYPGQTREALR